MTTDSAIMVRGSDISPTGGCPLTARRNLQSTTLRPIVLVALLTAGICVRLSTPTPFSQHSPLKFRREGVRVGLDCNDHRARRKCPNCPVVPNPSRVKQRSQLHYEELLGCDTGPKTQHRAWRSAFETRMQEPALFSLLAVSPLLEGSRPPRSPRG